VSTTGADDLPAGLTAGIVDPTWLAAIAVWLPQRRWFAGKHLVVRAVTADAAVPISLGGTRISDTVVLIAVHVAFDGAADQRYALPVAIVSMDRSDLTADDVHIIVRLDADRLLVDAMALPDTAALVVAAAFRSDTHRAGGGAARGRPRRSRLVAHPSIIRPLSVEQSNSSVLVGSTHIAKLVRRLEPGPNPDAELPEHLAAVRFEHAPALTATLELELPGESQPVDVLVVHDAIANEGDLWSVLLERLQGELAVGDAFDDRHLPLLQLVGRRTAELHMALAAPVDEDADVADRTRPEPFTLEWQHLLVASLRESLVATQAALVVADLSHHTDDVRVAADRARVAGLLTEPPEALLGEFRSLSTELVDSMRIRVHGDLHLGQILSTGDDIVFIDFEGEPGLPMERRLVKRSPLVDLAGLVRSIDYLGRHALRLAEEAGVGLDRHVEIDHRRIEWTRRLTAAVVAEYLTTIAPAHLVPARQTDAQMLLDLYLLDKGLYEIRYELANRPEWVGGPLTAVTEMITR
jgi:maltose alpha-D-glucosyltransferase/alpha-amylase